MFRKYKLKAWLKQLKNRLSRNKSRSRINKPDRGFWIAQVFQQRPCYRTAYRIVSLAGQNAPEWFEEKPSFLQAALHDCVDATKGGRFRHCWQLSYFVFDTPCFDAVNGTIAGVRP